MKKSRARLSFWIVCFLFGTVLRYDESTRIKNKLHKVAVKMHKFGIELNFVNEVE